MRTIFEIALIIFLSRSLSHFTHHPAAWDSAPPRSTSKGLAP